VSDEDAPGSRPIDGRFSAHLAVICDDLTRLAEVLDEPGADVNRPDDTGATALTLAVAHRHAGVVGMLLARDDIDVNAKDGTGSTPLAIAAGAGDDVLVARLVGRDDADVNLVDVHRMTPLYRAVAGRHVEAIRALLTHPATNVDITSRPFRATALEAALELGYPEIVDLLRRVGPAHSFGDVLSPTDDYVEPVPPDGPELLPRMPYDEVPLPPPPIKPPFS
jgi:ankyrin repeat protein